MIKVLSMFLVFLDFHPGFADLSTNIWLKQYLVKAVFFFVIATTKVNPSKVSYD